MCFATPSTPTSESSGILFEEEPVDDDDVGENGEEANIFEEAARANEGGAEVTNVLEEEVSDDNAV